jgi:RNA polymerase sigma-70 factor (ECF subfamily)
MEREASQADRVVELYVRYGGIVYARCRQILRDQAAAEDVTQETFLRVHRFSGAVPDEKEALSWLYRISTNLCLNAIRDGKIRPVLVADPPERAGPCPDESLANRNLVVRLIGRVSPNVQLTAWLHHIDGMPQGEIADLLGISRRSVAKRLAQFTRRSRKVLRMEGL